MANRYERVATLSGSTPVADAPVLIEAGALLHDAKTDALVCQLKLKNVSDKTVSSASVCIKLGEDGGDAREINHVYAAVFVSPGEEFGQDVAFDAGELGPTSFSAECTSVVFADGDVWSPSSKDEVGDELGDATMEAASKDSPCGDRDDSSDESEGEEKGAASDEERDEMDASESDPADGEEKKDHRLKTPQIIGIVVACLIALSIPIVFPQLFCKHESWIEATCDAPRTCKKCGKTEGDPLGHDWDEATCDAPKTCERCGATEGEALGHDPGEWKHVVDYVEATSGDVRECKRCGETVEKKNEEAVTSFVGNGKFAIPANDFCKRFDSAIRSFEGTDSLSVSLALDSNGTSADLEVKRKSRTIAFGGFFSDSSTPILYAMTDSENVYYNVLLHFGSDGSNYVAASIVAMIKAADPTLSTAEAKEVAKAALDNPVEKNGVTYAVVHSDGWWLSARIE